MSRIVGLNGAMCTSLLMFAIEERVLMGDLWLRRQENVLTK